MLDYVNDDQYLRTKYAKVYLPTIIEVPIDKIEHYTFIKTVSAGNLLGHIIKHNTIRDVYYLCLRDNSNTIKVDQANYDIMGFRKTKIEDCEKLAKTFHDAHIREQTGPDGKPNVFANIRTIQKNLVKVVVPPELDYNLPRRERYKDKCLINIKTKEKVDLSQGMSVIVQQTGLKSNLHVDMIIRCGYLLHDWTYKGERLDGKTWTDYFLQ